MAIKISNTTVIDNNRVLTNITGATGTYSTFHPAVSSITTALDFNIPVMSLTMTANTTFTESNKAEGKTSIFLLDTSSDNHTPTFSGNIKWKAGATPPWGSYRRWQVVLQCIDNTIVRGVASGYDATSAPPPSETITLGGTQSDPITFFGGSPVFSGGNYILNNGFVFKTNGVLYQRELNPFSSPPGLAVDTPWVSGHWCNVTPSTTYYIRATKNTYEAGGENANGFSDAVNTWLSLATERIWYYDGDQAYGSYGAKFLSYKIEIATDSGGTNIIATGYYRCNWEGGA